MNIPHIPVLYNEVIETFSNFDDGYVVDCTLGYGGHSEAILKNNPNIKMICCDQDAEAINFSKKRLELFGDRVIFEHARFSTVIKKYKEYPIKGILADIGVSSLQLDKKERGFGFESETLDMRMNPQNSLSAKEVVNNYSRDELEEILREYGEMRDFKRVTNAIVEHRPFKSAKELSSMI